MEADTGSTPLATLDEHLSRRNGEYKALRRGSVYGTDGYPYAPWTWPAGRCMLTDLPTELLLMIIDPLYQADLFHVAATCRRLAAPALDLLYQRDVANFDCISLRWPALSASCRPWSAPWSMAPPRTTPSVVLLTNRATGFRAPPATAIFAGLRS